MAIAISANDEHHPGGALSPPDIKAQHVEGGGPSSVQMGQENVIALLLQQQEEVLREIRDQKKGLALSHENKQEIARLVLSSLKKQRLQKQPATNDPPHHTPTGRCAARKTRAASKRTGKKRVVVRRRQRISRSSRSSRDEDRARKHHPASTAQESGPYEYSSSSDQNNGTCSPSATAESAGVSLDSATGTHEHRDDTPPSASTATVIRQRVEKRAEQAEVSLDGLWLPSLSPASGLGSPGTAVGRIPSSPNDGAATARGGRWVDASRSSMPRARKTGSLHVYEGREKSTGSRKVRPMTVDSHASRQCVQSQHLGLQEGELLPAGSGWDSRFGLGNGGEEGKSTRHGDGATADDDDNRNGGDDLTPPLIGNFSQQGEVSDVRNKESENVAMPPDISRHTASMLQRSQALVARAKAFCGQAARSSTADYSNRERSADLRFPPHVRSSANSFPITNQHHGGNTETGAANGDGDDAAGEARGILFSSSPYPYPTGGAALPASSLLGDVAEEEGESRISPPSTAGAGGSRAAGVQPDSLGASSLERTALAKTETETRAGPAVQHPTFSGGEDRTEDLEHQQRHLSEGVVATKAGAADGARALDDEGAEARQDRSASLASATSSFGSGQGRRRGRSGSGSSRKARKRRGEEPSRGDGGAEGESTAKIDTEWENEIAKNILSLYQTKLKADLDVKRSAKEHELTRKQQGYLTIEEEEDMLLEQQPQQQQQQQLVRYSNRAATAAPGRVRPPGNRNSCDGTKPSTVAAASNSDKPSGLDLHTAREATPPTRTRATAGNVATPSSSSRRPVTVATQPREVMVGRDLSLGRVVQTPCRTAAGASDAADKASGDRAAATGSKGRGGFRGGKAITVPTRGGGEAVVVVPKRPRPIWFAGSGAIQAEWSALPGGARVVRDLEGLEEQGRYTKYVAVVEGLLTAFLRADDQRGPPELVKRLWRQLVATCIAFGVRSTENRRFERALELLKRAGTLLSRQVLDKRASQELQAFVHDAYGLYFLRRGKSSAALDYVQKAMKTHARMRDWGHVTKCHLHSSVVLSKLNRHDEALRCLGQVLAMVEEGNLDVGGNSPQKLCLVAICYHNMAVEQLILRHAGEACMSSQNARRLARLCLSYSNRWLHSFEGTHKLALAELARSLSSSGSSSTGAGERGGDGESKEEQRDILKRLTEELFS